ncbi:hypothetical protein M407DRAFT_244406 [Tulasnella calospora MUT 4182]|uniref:Uncharacterized protein n=1 Tax=Tulasnella calospora MUT 4182 TaxID=1051891 RepID=A0A0C3Q5U5_9AGAM|nr:hypothetical protein M407DRAFT_244406 [Tulasnella calospora MUT 4182]
MGNENSTADDMKKKELALKRLVSQHLGLAAATAPEDPIPTTVTTAEPTPPDAAKTPGDSGSSTQPPEASQ